MFFLCLSVRCKVIARTVSLTQNKDGGKLVCLYGWMVTCHNNVSTSWKLLKTNKFQSLGEAMLTSCWMQLHLNGDLYSPHLTLPQTIILRHKINFIYSMLSKDKSVFCHFKCQMSTIIERRETKEKLSVWIAVQTLISLVKPVVKPVH